MASPVVLEALTRRFAPGARPAVDELSLSVQPGEVVSLVGPSGCGKSTTLRMVAGLEQPDSGEIRIGERSVLGLPPQERDVAMVFQGFALYPHMRVRDIMAFPLKMRGVAPAERERSVAEVAKMLAIEPLLERRPGQLSGGEQQRVAMGRAIVRRPQVFLFDEPLSNLDAALRAELRVELGKLLRRLGVTALYVTHDQVEAMTLSSRIAVLRAGRLEQLDTPRRIYEAPASMFVAGFFGAPPMNLLSVERAGAAARAEGVTVPCPDGELPAKLVVGVRPEHIALRSGASGDAAPAIASATPPADGGAKSRATTPGEGEQQTNKQLTGRGRITAIEPLGAETHLELVVGTQHVRARVTGFAGHAPGDAVEFSAPATALSWFDADSGKAWCGGAT